MKNIIITCLSLLMLGWITTASAQSDSTSDTTYLPDCNLQTWFDYVSDPSGATTLTAHVTGANGPLLYYWQVGGVAQNSGNSVLNMMIPSGTAVCLEVASVLLSIDSLQQTVDSNYCYANYCQTIYTNGDTTSGQGCQLQTWFDQAQEQNGTTTLTAHFTGASGPLSYYWLVNGNVQGYNQPVLNTAIPSGAEVCLEVTSFSFLIDSLQQTVDSNYCYANYCQTIYTNGDTASGQGCQLQVWFDQMPGLSGTTTLTANYSGTQGQPQFYWTVNNAIVSYQSSYTAVFAPGTTVCLSAFVDNPFFDSLQQVITYDSCYASYCNIIQGIDSSGGSGCNLQVWFNTAETPSGLLQLIPQVSGGSGQANLVWMIDSMYVAVGDSSFSGLVNPGTNVCLAAYDYTLVFDSLNQIIGADTCYQFYCATAISADTILGMDANTVSYEIYPNPVNDVLQVAMSGATSGLQFVVLDMEGRELMRVQDVTVIPVSGLKSGMYYLLPLDPSGTTKYAPQRFLRE